MSRPRQPLANLLVESVRAHSTRPIQPETLAATAEEVVSAGFLHRVNPAVYRRVKAAANAPDDWLAALAAARHAQLMRHMQASADIRIIGDCLAAVGAVGVVAKGPVAADLVWPAPDMREYYDVDVFVERSHFEQVLNSLIAAGCTLIDRNWSELNRTRRAEVALRGVLGTHIDLHWDIAVVPKLRRDFCVNLPAMLGRSRKALLGSGTNVTTFDPVDTVLHLVFHAAQAGANKLMWIGDIYYASQAEGFDWAEFEFRTVEAHLTVPAAMVLARVQRCLGLPNPPPVSITGAGGLWEVAARSWERRAPFPGLPDDPHIGGGWYSSARPHLTMALVEALSQWRERRKIERRVDSQGPDAQVLHMDVDDPRSRHAYLDYVRQGAG